MHCTKRIEDLGRIRERLEDIMDHDIFSIFDRIGNFRNKDMSEAFFDEKVSDDTRYDIIHDLVYAISSVSDEITYCLSIARGEELEE